MPVKTKRKAVVKEAPLTPKYKRLRLREWMMFWVLFAATITLVYTIFGDVDVRTLMPAEVTSTASDDQQTLVSELRAEVVNLNTALNGLEQGADNSNQILPGNDPIIQLLTSSTIPSVDGRKLVTYQDIYSSNNHPLFHYQWNSATATRVNRVEIPELGIQFTAPYSSTWGNPYFAVEPFEKDDVSERNGALALYRFGFVRFVKEEGADFLRQYALAVHDKVFPISGDPVKTEQDFKNWVELSLAPHDPSTVAEGYAYKITYQQINGVSVARADRTFPCGESAGMGPCGTIVTYYVLGSKGIGEFMERTEFSENFTEFQSIIRSIRPL